MFYWVCAWVPSGPEQAEWESDREDAPTPLERFISRHLSTLRSARIEPSLLEVEASPAGVRLLDLDDPRIECFIGYVRGSPVDRSKRNGRATAKTLRLPSNGSSRAI